MTQLLNCITCVHNVVPLKRKGESLNLILDPYIHLTMKYHKKVFDLFYFVFSSLEIFYIYRMKLKPHDRIAYLYNTCS